MSGQGTGDETTTIEISQLPGKVQFPIEISQLLGKEGGRLSSLSSRRGWAIGSLASALTSPVPLIYLVSVKRE